MKSLSNDELLNVFNSRAQQIMDALVNKRQWDVAMPLMERLYSVMLEMQFRSKGTSFMPLTVGNVIQEIHKQIGDDVCWMDIDKIFLAAGLPVPDRRVGDKVAMKQNCNVFVDTMCSGGHWASYKEIREALEEILPLVGGKLEAKIRRLLHGNPGEDLGRDSETG